MKGVYAAIFRLEKTTSIEIGALGNIEFEKGIYVYLGSAMTNAEKRINRHFGEVENLHWHIDYFSEVAEPIDYFLLPESSEYECVLADAVSKLGEPVKGFGCSDCGCSSHMYRVEI